MRISMIFLCCSICMLSCNGQNSSTSAQHNATAERIDTVFSQGTRDLRSNLIPDSVFEMKKLRHLAIIGMDCDYGDHTNCWMISEIPARIKELKELETLFLNVNALRSLPPEMSELKNLRAVDLSDNQALKNIESLMNLPKLEKLSLFGCGLERLPVTIIRLKSLRYLGLSGNNLPDFEIARVRKALPDCQVIFSK